jgi:3-methyladenine DNA glycosylase/8-oxoguanine DNA glycosylase
MNAFAAVKFHEVCEACPVLADLIDTRASQFVVKPKTMPVAEALAEIIIAQMLTQKEAEHLITELKKKARGDRIWQLKEKDLFEAGLSRSKARTINLMAQQYLNDSRCFEDWRTASADIIRKRMNMLWGMGEWTIDMLLLRYFGHQNVWPKQDARLNRVVEKLKRYCEHHGIVWKLDPDRAAPYRSSLVLMLWSLEDDERLYH